MSDSVLHVKNLNKVIDAFRKAPKLAAEKVEEAGIEIVEVLNRHNRYFHEWSHQKHNLQKDIGGKVEGNVITHGLGFYPSQTAVLYGGSKVSYGTILHEGKFNDPWIETGVEDNKKKMEKIYNKRMKELVEEI